MFGYGEVDVAVGGIGSPFGLQLLDQATNGIQAPGGPGHAVRRQDVQPCHVRHEGLDIAFTDDFHGAAFLARTGQDLVVNICVVLHKFHFITTPEQVATQHIPNDVAAGVAQVAEVIDRNPTAVDAHPARFQRFKHLGATGQGVGQPQGHGWGEL